MRRNIFWIICVVFTVTLNVSCEDATLSPSTDLIDVRIMGGGAYGGINPVIEHDPELKIMERY